ncbi:MAG: PQQ-like beta-propeller repeat protein [Anaerolineaceae bacterium]|nr:PQQ-like beta-propeller repeat protein [Anaerolineaceae bacterium]
MKNRKLGIILLLIIGSLLFSSCSRTLSATSWPGTTVEGETAFVAYGNGVYSVDLNSAGINWSYPNDEKSQAQFYAPPLIHEGLLIVGDYEKTLYGLEESTGMQKWSFEANGKWIASPMVKDEMIFAPCADHNLYALDLNGNLQWTFETGQALWSQPVSNGGDIYLGSMDHSVYAINPKNGALAWQKDLGGAIVSTPFLDEESGILYVGTLANEVVALDTERGSEIWRYETVSGLWGTPVINEGVLYFADDLGNIYALTAGEKLSEVWKMETQEVITGSPAITPDGLVFQTESGTVLFVKFDGKSKRAQTIEGSLYGAPQTNEDFLVISIAKADNLLSIMDFDGNEVRTFAPPKK